jgi:Tol biopolymer transport system component
MSTTDRVERDLTAWFGETAAPRTPDYTDDILRQTAHSRQRPRWTFPERWLPMSVITFGRVTLRPVPWRAVGLLVALGLLLAVAAALYVGSPQRLPPPFGTAANGLVAYEKGGDIYAVDPTTNARRAVVVGSAVEGQPSYSLDGTRLAFVRTTGTGKVIVVADASGGNQVEIPMTPLADVGNLAWSPDGRWIAAPAGDGDTSTLWIVDTVARAASKIDGLALDDEGLYWRPPDGRQLMVTARESTGLRFALVSPSDGTIELLPPVGYLGGQFRPAGWTPDGSRFAYAADPTNGEVHVLDADGRHDIVIQPSMKGDGTRYPRLSNDGRRILVMEGGPDGKTWLSVAPSDGSKPAIRISDLYPDGIGTHYIWSPDDSMIEFEPNMGPHVLLDPAGGPTSAPPWVTEGAESWQRRAP